MTVMNLMNAKVIPRWARQILGLNCLKLDNLVSSRIYPLFKMQLAVLRKSVECSPALIVVLLAYGHVTEIVSCILIARNSVSKPGRLSAWSKERSPHITASTAANEQSTHREKTPSR